MKLDLSQVLEALPGQVWIALPDGQAEFVSQRWCDFTGLSSNQAIPHGWRAVMREDDVQRLLTHWNSPDHPKGSVDMEASLRRHDGTFHPFRISLAPIFDDSGQVLRWCGINTDLRGQPNANALSPILTDAVRSAGHDETDNELALRLAHAQLTVAQQVSATGSFTADLFADTHTWSDELYRICEFEVGAPVTTATLRDVVHPEDVGGFDSVIQRANAGQDLDFAFRIITRHGTVKHLSGAARVTQHTAGRPIFMGAVQDVTARKLAEQVLKTREGELTRALGHLSEAQRLGKTGSFTADLAADEHIWSDGFYQICELDPGSIKITNATLAAFVVADDMQYFSGAIRRALAGENPDFAFRIHTSKGMKHLRGVAHHLEEFGDRPVFIGAVQDVTDSIIAEEALTRARTELTHVERVLTLGALTASIAHEVNQPLSGIINNATACLGMLAETPPDIEGARVTTQRTLRDASRAADVIHRLRAMFSHKPLTKEPMDLNEATREVLAISASELQVSRVSVSTALDAELPFVSADRVQIQQVILNLLLNAIDAMRTVNDRPRKLLVVTAREHSNLVRLSVHDSGHGIDPQNLEKLFEAYFTTKAQGLGVGLSISRAIIADHGGRLWAAANDGPGAVFSFSLPCVSAPARE